jgi:hypothetical protein
MPVWLISLLPEIWKFLKHWGVYILLTLVLVGGPYLLYRKGYNDGYKSKVCPPTYTVGDGGVVNNHYKEDTFKVLGIDFKLLFIKCRFGY